MYNQELSTRKQNTKVMTFPNKEAIYSMVSKSVKDNETTPKQETQKAICNNPLFETVLTLLLLDENNLESNLFLMVIAALFTD